MTRHPLFWLPNVLTVARCAMGAGVAALVYVIARHEMALLGSAVFDNDMRVFHLTLASDFRTFWGGIAFLVFCIAAVTDFLDGYLARRWEVESRFGRLLDPIADKVIVGLPLLVLAGMAGWPLAIALPVFAIIFRDVLITCLRFAGLGANVMSVKFIAKLKTFIEMILIAALLLIMALADSDAPLLPSYLTLWTITLWGTAALSVYTGLRYLIGLVMPAKPVKAPEE